METVIKKNAPQPQIVERGNRPYVFLDIDGPLATAFCWGKDVENKWGWYMFDPRCVEVVNKIDKAYSPIWILSSDWQYHGDLDTINEYFKYRGVDIKFSDNTDTNTKLGLPNITLESRYRGFRADQIITYCSKNNISEYVAIDDLYLDLLDESKFVHIHNEWKGLAAKGAFEEICEKIENQIR